MTPSLENCPPEIADLVCKALLRINEAYEQSEKAEDALVEIVADHLTDNSLANEYLITYGRIAVLEMRKRQSHTEHRSRTGTSGR